MSLHGAVVLLATFLLATSVLVTQGSITCYTEPSVAGEFNCRASTNNFYATIEECCVERNGHFFQGVGDASCQACIVFGWFNGSEVIIEERGDYTILEVGFIKGALFEEFLQQDRRGELHFVISVTPGTAREGANFDFTVLSRSAQIGDATIPARIWTFIRFDRITLEIPEDFTLTLIGANAAANAVLNAAAPNTFVIPKIRVIIEDREDATLQFTASDCFSNLEGELFIVPMVQLLTAIATDLTVRIVPINISEVIDRNLLPALPPIPAFNPRAPNIATSAADFSTTPAEITFVAGGATTIRLDPGIEIIDDEINEVEELFALILEVADVIDPARVDLQSGHYASLARIFDDDPINIGFEQERYTVFKDNGQLSRIPIIKENGQKSELTFGVIVTLTLGSDPTTATADVDFFASPPIQRQDLGDLEQFITYVFEIYDDSPPVPEPTETFQIQLSLEDEGLTNVNLAASSGSLFATATIVIIDDDDMIIGWEQNVTRVNESQSILELCVRVSNLDDTVEFPAGFEVSLAANTIRDTAADPGDYTALVADSDIFFDIIDDDTRRTCIEVVINNDNLLEGVEFFRIEVVPDPFVTNFPSDVRLDPALTFVKILDNDFVQIGFNQTEYVVLEGDGVATLYVVVLRGNLQRSVSVTFSTIPGTAAAISDFLPVTRMLTFDANVRTNIVSITIVNDTLTELEELFRASLTRDPLDSPSDVVIDPDEATVRILNDDANVTIGWEKGYTSVNEGDGVVEICVRTLNVIGNPFPPDITITLAANTIPVTAEDPGDYGRLSESRGDLFLTDITATNSRACIEVSINDDTQPERIEVFTVQVVHPTGLPVNFFLEPDETVVAIIDND